MSPRSEELIASAEERLRLARTALGGGFASGAVSAAYYSTARFDRELFAGARRLQELRKAADYDARQLSDDEAEALVNEAERSVAAVAAMLG